MNKKSFLRGFGVGVLFTALVLSISFSIRTSDTAIMKEARKLGMSFANNEGNDRVIDEATATPKATDLQKKNTKKKSSEKKQTATAEPKSTGEDSSFQDEKQKMQSDLQNEEKTLTIKSGEWSTGVSEELQRLGVVDDAEAFDHYLDAYGYSSKLVVGNYTVQKGESYEELAKKITGRK